MYQLINDELTVSVLDPVADVGQLGSRYCTGGYIWQVSDNRRGPLLSGRCYPDPHPPVFDGQGAPEAFVTPLGSSDVPVGETVTVIGVGLVKRTSAAVPFTVRDNPEVVRFCKWTVSASRSRITMRTVQQAGDRALELVRRVEIDGRKVVSRTDIINRSPSLLPLRYFAHPFFPLNPDLRCFTPAFTLAVPDNPGYRQADDGTVFMRDSYDWEKGLFFKLTVAPGTLFEADAAHPQVASVKINADYPLESLPIWANHRTFSPEPYMAAEVAPGKTYSWGITYGF
jgi:hypothetical protein